MRVAGSALTRRSTRGFSRTIRCRSTMQCLAAMNCSRKRLYSNAVAPGPGHLGRKVVKKRSRWGHVKVRSVAPAVEAGGALNGVRIDLTSAVMRSEEHTSELQSLMRISYADFCLKKKNRILCT